MPEELVLVKEHCIANGGTLLLEPVEERLDAEDVCGVQRDVGNASNCLSPFHARKALREGEDPGMRLGGAGARA